MMNGELAGFIICKFKVRMKLVRNLIVVLICTFSAGVGYSHDFFFSFAEVEYNEIRQVFEGTITVTTHDMERALEKDSLLLAEIDPVNLSNEQVEIIETYLFNHFKIRTNKNAQLHLIGFESLLNGVTNFYFESEKIELSNNILYVYDLLMDEYPDQQNKITFIYRNTSHTLTFLHSETNKNLILTHEE